MWAALSDAYRARLTRKGITKRKYERGVSLSEARGHAKTPEHPEDVVRNPERYREYVERAASWQEKVIARKERMFGDRLKWNEEHGIRNVMVGFKEQEVPVPGVRLLKEAMELSDEDFEDYAKLQNDPEWRFLWYH